MTFEGTLSLLIEESEDKPKYELILPKKYSRIYREHRDSFASGYMIDIMDGGVVSEPVPLSKRGDEVKRIKEEWEPTILLSDFQLLLYLKRKKEDASKYGIAKKKYDSKVMYIINDTTGMNTEAISWNYWLEPVVTYKDYTSQGVANDFDKLFDNL